MAACNQTDIPVLNIQEDPCIQGSLITSCIFYGLAIDYLGAQISSSFFDVLGLIVAKLEAGNIDATNLEEDNRAQALLIEALQNSIAESLVTLSEVQALLDECCPEPTTTVTPTTTIAPTTSTTTQNAVSSMYFTIGPDGYSACNSMSGVTLYWAGITGPEGKRMYQNPELTIPWNDFTYAVNSTNVYGIANGFASVQGVCSDFNTTTTTNGVGPTINANYSATACDTSGGFQTVTLINGTSICDTNVYLSSGFYMLPTQFYITYQGVSRLFQKDSQNQFAYPQGPCIDCSTTTTTTTSVNSYNYTVAASSTSDRNYSCSNPFTSGQQTLWASTYIPGDVQKFYTDSNLINPYIGNVNDYYAYMIGWPSGILYTGQMGADGTMFNKSVCEEPTTTTTSTTTAAPTTTTTSTTTIAPGITNFSIIGENPRAIIMDAQGNVYTANSNSDDITKITLSGAVSILGSTGRNPTDLVMDSSGNIYTANFQGNSITKVTPEGVSTQFATLGFVSPSAIAIDSLGNLYTANSQTNNVSKITPSGNVSILGTAGTFPYGIVVDAQDNIYVSNFSSNNVTKITPLGVSTVLGNTGIGPREIAIDAQGNIYTANSSSNTVTKITPAGVSTTLGNTGSFPIGITIDSSGDVYTANINGNSVTRITPTGETTSFSSNGVFPDDLVTGFGYLFVTNASGSTVSRIPLPTTTTTTVAPGLTCPEGFPNRTTGNGTMTLSNGVTLTTTYTGPTLLSGNFNPPFTTCGNSFKGNDGAGGTMYLNYTGGAFTLTLTFSQPQSHIAFGISGMGIYNQPGITESYTFTTNGGSTQITELNGCGNFQVQGFNTLVGSNNNGTASDGSGAIQVTSSGLFTEVTITGNNPGSLNGVGIDLYLCSNLIIE